MGIVLYRVAALVTTLLCLHLLPQNVSGDVISPGKLARRSGEDVVFMWNTTNNKAILNITFSKAEDSNGPKVLITGNQTRKVSSFNKAGRFHFRGILSAGHAWFEIKNVTSMDYGQYVVKIWVTGASGFENSTAELRVIHVPTAEPDSGTTLDYPKSTTHRLSSTGDNSPSSEPTETQNTEAVKSKCSCSTVIAAYVSISVLFGTVIVLLMLYICKIHPRLGFKGIKGSSTECERNNAPKEAPIALEKIRSAPAQDGEPHPEEPEQETYEVVPYESQGQLYGNPDPDMPTQPKHDKPADDPVHTTPALPALPRLPQQRSIYQGLNRATQLPSQKQDEYEVTCEGTKSNNQVEELNVDPSRYEPLMIKKPLAQYESLYINKEPEKEDEEELYIPIT